jgi:two-component system NtrC family sensor kinase
MNFIKGNQPFIQTIKERCRVCYTCVRDCPVKAIRIAGGQAEVMPGNCIGCGNCVRVCRQNAKQYIKSIAKVYQLLNSGQKTAALIAPSFVADFYEIDYKRFVAGIRSLGFDYVHEVAFGADLVARHTIDLTKNNPTNSYIEPSCPAVTEYIKCYHPDLVQFIAPVVSPMIATARVVRALYGNDVRKVFIGPCIAKKFEAIGEEVESEVDEVLTFSELREIFVERGINFNSIETSDFDKPHGGKGALFPLSRGMHQAVDLNESLLLGDIVAADGREGFIDAIKAFESGDLDATLLELLCCKGCIMGPGMSVEDSPFKRRSRVSKYVRNIMRNRNKAEWKDEIDKYKDLDLSRTFSPTDQRSSFTDESDIIATLQKMGKTKPEDELNCGACGYETCREHADAIIKGRAEIEMCLPYTIEKLHKTVLELNMSSEMLANTREALKQSEKLASMGQLAAGIAHELNNPLGAVLMYAHIILDEIERESHFRDDLHIIVQEADRCKKIVSGLLNFARQSKVMLTDTNICEMVTQTLKVLKIPDTVKIKTICPGPGINAEIDRDQIIQVLNNLINNAITAMNDVGELIVATQDAGSSVIIKIKDNGCGIPEKNLKKIFEPFFTTKKMGQGTGLGLAVIYGIVKMHRGSITVESNADAEKGPTGTEFIVTLPKIREKI